MGSWTQQALGGGWTSGALEDDEPPEVGVTLEGLDADAAAADQARFKPWSGPEQIPATNNASAGAAMWGTQADPNASLWDTLAEGVGDAGARASNAMYMGYGDELAGLVGGDAARDNVRNRMQLAKERSPTASIVGDVVGGAVPAAATGGISAGAMRALPFAGRLAAGAGLAGEQAAVTAAGYADDGDRWEAAQEALGPGMAFGLAGEAAGEAGSRALKYGAEKAAPFFRDSGRIDRVASSGRTGPAMDDLGRERAIELGGWMEDQGVTGMTPGRVAKQSTALVDQYGGQQRQLVDDIMSRPEPVNVNTGDTTDYLEELARSQDTLAPSTAESKAGIYRQEAGNILDQSQIGEGAMSASMPFDEALRNRQAYDDMANHAGRGKDTLTEGVANDAAGSLRGGLRSALHEQAPELAPQWEGVQSNLSNALDVQAPSVSKDMRQSGEAPVSFTSMIGGAVSGIPGMLGAAAAKTGGRAAMADVQRGAAATLEAGGRNAPAVEAFGGFAGGLGAQQSRNIDTKEAGFANYASMAPGGEVQGSRGYMLPQAALELMRQPGALGKWEREFFDAANSNDTHALSQLIVRLSHTDDEFAQTILPQLKQLTAEGF